MKRYLVISVIFISLIMPLSSQAGEFTQKDRERLIRLEIKVEEGQKALQKQIDGLTTTMQRQIDSLQLATQRQTDDLRILLLWGFGILFGGMGLLIGFVIWDRRTALEPVAKKYRELAKKERSTKTF